MITNGLLSPRLEKVIPRKDFVTLRIKIRDEFLGIKLPQNSVEGKEFYVEAIGPDVEDLKIGERVMSTGQLGVDWSFVPNHPNLIIIREGNIVVKFQEDVQ